MEYTPESLEYAVSVFYHGDQEERTKAHAWLTTAQRAPEAWTIVWELLQPDKGTEVQFFAATTLHTKILRCWNELPPESYEELKHKLLQAIATYSNGPKIVINRLCISLAAFILQRGTPDLTEILNPLSSVENTSLLLEVLTVIPEEYNSMTMGSTLRSKNRAALQLACPAVLNDMLHYLSSVYNDYSKSPPSEEVVQSWLTAATCANSWLSLGGVDSPDTVTPLTDRMPLCQSLMTAIHILFMCYESVTDTALDCCEACTWAIRAAGTAGESHRYAATALQLLSGLGELAACVCARYRATSCTDEELLSAIITCAVTLAETHSTILVKTIEAGGNAAAGARQFVEVLLEEQAAPGFYPIQETRSNLVFGFWYTLQGEIINTLEDTDGVVNSVWRDVFTRLLMVLIHKSEAAPDNLLSRDDQELLRCYRQDIADTVMHCYSILGDSCWPIIENIYSSIESESGREAALHVFLALADAAPHQRTPDGVPTMLEHAMRIVGVAEGGRLLDTALDCLGAYAAWLSSISSSRASLLANECVSAAGAALSRSSACAALALRRLCVECSAPSASLVTNVVNAALSEAGRSDAWVRRQLLSAAGATLAASPHDVAAPLMQSLIESLSTELSADITQPEIEHIASAAESTAALASTLTAQPMLLCSLMRTVLPTLTRFTQHPRLIEPMFQLLKQGVSRLLENSYALLNDVGELTINAMQRHPHPAGLDLVKLLVLVFNEEWTECPRLLHTSVLLSSRAVAVDPSANSDLTEELFQLLFTIAKKIPRALDWIDDLLPDLVELSCNCIRVWEANAARNACTFLSALVLLRPATVRPAAPALTASVLRCIGGATPRNQIAPLVDLLLSMNSAAWPAADGDSEAQGESLGTWLRAALLYDGFPTQYATQSHKHKFIAAVVKEKSSKRRLTETVQEFSLICRGLIDTEYARETLGSKLMVSIMRAAKDETCQMLVEGILRMYEQDGKQADGSRGVR